MGVVFRRFPTPPGGGIGGPRPGIAGAAPGGGLGAPKLGGFGAEPEGSPGSDKYVESEFAPVSTPPRLFLNFGIPPANRPPSCGAESTPDDGVSLDPWSLLLLARFPGTGGARPPGGFGAPPKLGMGGAPPTGGPDEEDDLSTMGAERSLVTAFFKALPLLISDKRAFYVDVVSKTFLSDLYPIIASLEGASTVATYSAGTSCWRARR